MRFAIPHLLPDFVLPSLVLPSFLKALLSEKRELRINILIWNFSALYAAVREWNSAAKFTPEESNRLCFCFDSSLPLGSAQHQKIVVIDYASRDLAIRSPIARPARIRTILP
jgi:hypothetical protein